MGRRRDYTGVGVPPCYRCKCELTQENWAGWGKNGHSYQCRPCVSLRNKEYAAANPEKIAATIARKTKMRRDRTPEEKLLSRLKDHKTFALRQYGLSKEEYSARWDDQGHSCAICKTTDTAPYRIMLLDHCHSTNKARGFLCYNCNIVLGHAKDNREVLENSIKYLSKYELVHADS